jgi:hypothetical protein
MIAFGIVGLATSPSGWWGKHAALWQLIPIFAVNILSGFILLVEGRRGDEVTGGTEGPSRKGFIGFVVWLVFGAQSPNPQRGNGGT